MHKCTKRYSDEHISVDYEKLKELAQPPSNQKRVKHMKKNILEVFMGSGNYPVPVPIYHLDA